MNTLNGKNNKKNNREIKLFETRMTLCFQTAFFYHRMHESNDDGYTKEKGVC